MGLRYVMFGIGLLLSLGAGAQVDSIGEWRSLQSFSKGEYVTESENSIIYTTGNALFYLDKEDLSITTLTRTDGLAGGRISLLKYHPPTETLLIVYENSTIDLLRDGRFITLRQIDNFNFSGDKRIYDLSFGADNRVYIAAGYGVSALSLDDRTFLFTTFTGVRVQGAVEHDGQVYAATDEGLYRVPLRGTNLNDFNTWSLLGFAEGLPGDYTSSAIAVWRERLYFGVNEDVWSLSGADRPTLFYDAPLLENRLQYLSAGPSLLLAGYRCTSSRCVDRAVMALQESGSATRLPDCAFLTNYALEDDRGRIWFGDEAQRIRYLPAADGECRRLSYPGPPLDENYRLLHDGTSLWVAPGRLDENTSPSFDLDGLFRFTDGSWSVINRDNTAAFLGMDGQPNGDDDFGTVIDVDYDPVNRIHYFSSFFEGVVGLDADGQATLYDESNSSLQIAPEAGPGRVRAAGAATDASGFTYFAVNLAADNGIVAVRSPEGEWAALGQGCDLNSAIAVVVDQQGFVWVLHRSSITGGLTVIDPMDTPMDPSDDRCRTITSSNSALPTNALRSIVVDLDGRVWVGTTLGIVIFGCGDDVLDPEVCQGNRPAVAAEDGFGGLLLETVEVRTIAVDGANRKWIGTSGGAFLLSEDGSEQLVFFDRGNSPLLDNSINDIAINPNTGTVYFGTELGIISYRSDATSAEETFASDLVIFPNPVAPDYAGPIAISGLARDARVKITDVSGKLVEEGTALGGQFTWSGQDYNGRRVTTGVYLVFASSPPDFGLGESGSGAAVVGKIVFVR